MIDPCACNLLLTQEGTKTRASIIIDPEFDPIDLMLLQREINNFIAKLTQLRLQDNPKEGPKNE